MNAYKQISERVAESIQFSRKRAIAYSVIYRTVRGSIIVLSAVAAALSRFSRAPWAAPALSCIVAILAALEAWLKPGKIYREHFRFNDLYIDAETRLALIPLADIVRLKEFADTLEILDKQYRAAIED